MIDPRLASASRTKAHFTATLLSRTDTEIMSLGTVRDGSVTISATELLGGSAAITLDSPTANTTNFDTDRVRIDYHPGIPGVEPWPLGVYLFDSPTLRHSADRLTYAVDLQSKMVIPDGEATEQAYSVPAGANLIAAATTLLASTGETRIAVTPSDATAREAIVFEPATSKLAIINTLLEAAGYWALWCDREGQYRIEPYTRPADRPLIFTFEAGTTCVHRPEWDRTQDTASIPNLAILATTGDDDTEPLVGVARDVNPDHPWSYPNLGRWRRWTGSKGPIEAADQATIDALAARRLTDAQSPVANIAIEHALLPLDRNQLVRFIDAPIDAMATIQEITIPSFAFNAHARTRLREVTSLD